MSAHVWRTHEDALLRKHYRNDGPAYCAERLGLRVVQVYWRAQHLGLKTTRPRGRSFQCGHDHRRKIPVPMKRKTSK